MNIEISTMIDCKNRCIFCPQKTIIARYKKIGGTPKLPMSFSTFTQCLEKLPRETHILFSGMCECFLNPRCSDMILYAHEKGFRISVYTTMVGMTLKDVEQMKKINFPRDSHSFVVHLPSKGNIEHFDMRDPYMQVLSEIYESALPAVYHYHGLALDERVATFFENKVATIEQYLVHSRAGNLTKNTLPVLKRRKGIIGCLKVKLYGSYGHVLMPDGTMVLCCQDYSMKHILGNLKNQTWQELMNSAEMKKVEAGLKDERIDILCRTCEFAYNINWKARLANKTIRLPDHHE